MQLEKQLEEYVIENLKSRGWRYVEPSELARQGSEVLLKEILIKKIKEINDGDYLTEEDVNEVLRKLEIEPCDQNGVSRILHYLKYGVDIKLEKLRIVKKIFLIDYENSEKNDFLVTNQLSVVDRERVRLDVVLFVNGIPLVNIELKKPYSARKDWSDAYRDIKYYEKTISEFYKYAQIGIAFATEVRYFPIVPWQEDVIKDVWRKDDLKEYEAIFEMLEPGNLIDIIRNFLFVKEAHGEMTKVICRYMQFRAANKIYQRVIDNLEGRTHKNKGLIWHWQGSGKTFTMIFACHKLYLKLGNPSIFFVVDRIDLEKQFNEEFLGKLKLNFEVERIESIEHLKEVLSWDYWGVKRGVFLTLLHKFNIDVELFEKVLGDKKIVQRKDIICFFDEVHRGQYGVLKSKLKNILKSAFHFGFTGTPVAQIERNTFDEFSYPSEGEFYLDRYFLDEAERDGYIVPIVYQPRLDDAYLKSEDIEWFLEQIDFEEVGDELIKEKIKEEVRNKINTITAFLENENRIAKIIPDIVKHFRENFDGKFKALIVTGSRLACVHYKRKLDELIPPEYSEVVMTFQSDKEEKPEILEYKNELRERFKNNDEKAIMKEIIDKFRGNEYPKILIVTDMLITGFDEPKLGVMYLDKLLKNHRLLQAVARVNRPFKDLKAAGLVVDYVGILKYLNKALKFYSREEIRGSGGIIDKKQIFDEFKRLIEELKNIFEERNIKVGDFGRENVDRAIEVLLSDENIGNTFENTYNKCSKIFETLGSFEEKIEFLVEYKWFSLVYEGYLKLSHKPLSLDIEIYLERTKKLLQELIEFKDLEEITSPLLIDLNYIKQLKEKNLNEKEKAIAILNALDKLVITLGPKNPIYRLIRERVEKLIKEWRERKIDYRRLIEEENMILGWLEEMEKEKKQLNFDDAKYGIFLVLKGKLEDLGQEGILNIEKRIFSVIESLIATKGWQDNRALRQMVERSLREVLIELRSEYKWSYDDFAKLYEEVLGVIYENT